MRGVITNGPVLADSSRTHDPTNSGNVRTGRSACALTSDEYPMTAVHTAHASKTLEVMKAANRKRRPVLYVLSSLEAISQMQTSPCWERHVENYLGMVQLASARILLRASVR